MASSTDEFAARARSIFDALGGPDTSGWKLDTQQGFKPGAEDGRDSSDEEEGEGPQPLEGATGSDEEGVEEANQYRVNASCAYVRAFEQEEEEDEFDRQAAGSGDEGSRPLRSMEVLEDNAFDRMHSQLYSQQHRGMLRAEQQQQQQQADIYEPSPAAAGDGAAAGTAPAAMDIDEDLPALEPAAAPPAPAKDVQQGPLKQDAGQGTAQQQQQQPAKRPRTGFGQVWVPPHRRPDFKPADEPAQAQHHNDEQQQQQRRVRFADGGPGQQQQQQQQGRSWARRNQGRGRGRGSFVPDHVRNPHKYTVYTLDEPLYVGQGGGDDRDNERAAATAGVLGSQAAASSSSSSSRAATGAAGSVLQQEPAGNWMHDDAPMLLDAPQTVQPSVHVATVTGNGETTAPVQPPAAGAIKFQPSSKRNSGDAGGIQPASKTVTAANAVSANVAKHLGAFADDDEPSVGAHAPAAVEKSRKSSRHYRKKHGDNEDA